MPCRTLMTSEDVTTRLVLPQHPPGARTDLLSHPGRSKGRTDGGIASDSFLPESSPSRHFWKRGSAPSRAFHERHRPMDARQDSDFGGFRHRGLGCTRRISPVVRQIRAPHTQIITKPSLLPRNNFHTLPSPRHCHLSV